MYCSCSPSITASAGTGPGPVYEQVDGKLQPHDSLQYSAISLEVTLIRNIPYYTSRCVRSQDLQVHQT